MPEPRNPLTDVLSVLTLPANAVASFFEAMQSFRTTMEQLNGTAARVNRLLDDVEQPIRTLTPQVAKAAERADKLMDAMTEPIDRLAPQLMRLSETLASPALRRLPQDLNELMAALSDVPRQLAPLTRMAQTAGNLFGFRGLGEPTAPAPARPIPTTSTPAKKSATKKTPAKKARSRKSTAKKQAKKAPAKKQPAKKRATPPLALATRTSATFARAAARHRS
jgi:ABC-type transporter Mla subunit MlaD